MVDIFISYSHSDKEFAEKLAQALEARPARFRVWRDENELLPAEVFFKKIKSALQRSNSTIVIWSEASRNSSRVHREASIADYLGTLIQVSIDGSDPPDMYRDQYTLKFLQNVSAVDRKSQQFVDLVKTLAKMKCKKRVYALTKYIIAIAITSLFSAILFWSGARSNADSEQLRILQGTVSLNTDTQNRGRPISSPIKGDCNANEQPGGGTDIGIVYDEIEFETAFINDPVVHIGLSNINVGESDPANIEDVKVLRLKVRIDDVSRTGFTYSFATWCDTTVHSAEANWIAISTPK